MHWDIDKADYSCHLIMDTKLRPVETWGAF